MVDASSFTEELRALCGDLRLGPPSPDRLNHAAARIDRLGRQVHGLGWTRDHEVGGCLTAAVGELIGARDLAEIERAESVRAAIRQLEMGLALSNEELRPQHAAPVTELTAQQGTRDERA